MQYVEFYKLKNDGSQEVIATCGMKDGVVVCEGDEALIENLAKDGILDYSQAPPQKIFSKDGPRFLEQLKYNFKSGYLNASEMRER